MLYPISLLRCKNQPNSCARKSTNSSDSNVIAFRPNTPSNTTVVPVFNAVDGCGSELSYSSFASLSITSLYCTKLSPAATTVYQVARVANREKANRPFPFLPRVYEVRLGCRSEEHTSELQSRENLVCRLLF